MNYPCILWWSPPWRYSCKPATATHLWPKPRLNGWLRTARALTTFPLLPSSPLTPRSPPCQRPVHRPDHLPEQSITGRARDETGSPAVVNWRCPHYVDGLLIVALSSPLRRSCVRRDSHSSYRRYNRRATDSSRYRSLLPGICMVHIRDVCVLIPATVNIGRLVYHYRRCCRWLRHMTRTDAS